MTCTDIVVARKLMYRHDGNTFSHSKSKKKSVKAYLPELTE